MDNYSDPLATAQGRAEEDLWFLPGPLADAPDDLPPGPRGGRMRPRSFRIGRGPRLVWRRFWRGLPRGSGRWMIGFGAVPRGGGTGWR